MQENRAFFEGNEQAKRFRARILKAMDILTVTLNPSVDETIYVDSLKPQDTNRVLNVETDAGGKGVNVARIAKTLGCQVMATGFLSGKTGRFVQAVLDVEAVPNEFVWLRHGHTRRNLCIEDQQGNPPTTLNEQGPSVSEEAWRALVEKIRVWLPSVRWMAVGGSLPPGAPPDAYRILIQMAREAKVACVLDSDGAPMVAGLEAVPTLIKPNEREAERLMGSPLPSDEAIFEAARHLSGRGIPYVIISRGAKGADAVSPEGAFRAIPPSVISRSTIGSGDSMVAGILSRLIVGDPFPEALRWGTAAGAATATTSGAEIADKETILELLPGAVVSEWQK